VEHAAALGRRYRKAGKWEKAAILTELCLATGYHRKSHATIRTY